MSEHERKCPTCKGTGLDPDKDPSCACKRVCGDVPEEADNPLAVCKKLPLEREVPRV